MKTNIKLGVMALGIAVFMVAPPVSAATSPSLGLANSFTILSGTYSNSTAGTTISGDVGYTTPPVTTPTINGTTHVADSVYNQAGIDQGVALSALASQPCTVNFAPGPIDLASDTTHGTVGVYTPGVYCISGAASVGGGGTITLTGAGTYIFRMTGALTTSANSIIAFAGGASACNVWWTPGSATVIGANSTFGGNDIDASGITIGNNALWTGRALAFGGTVSTDNDTLSNAACYTSPSTGGGTSGTGTGTGTGASTGATSSQNSLASTKTPGLPNTGLSQPASTSTLKNLVFIGALTAGAVAVRTVRKRA